MSGIDAMGGPAAGPFRLINATRRIVSESRSEAGAGVNIDARAAAGGFDAATTTAPLWSCPHGAGT